jgi:cell wall-associated NlpC family hydrolase
VIATNLDIIEAARTWKGVRWRHQGRNRLGVDCIGLLRVVADQLGLIPGVDFDGYGRMPDGRLRPELDKLLVRRVGPYQLGDVLLMRFEKEPQHVAIVTDKGIIHSAAQARKVVEHGMDAIWNSRVVAAYQWPEVEYV